jgi:anti-sigma factor RsiW
MTDNEPLETAACDPVRAQFALYLYGELSFDQEEQVESHLEACAACRAALEKEKELHAEFDKMELEPPTSLLRECRLGLSDRLRAEPPPPRAARASWWDRFVDSITPRPLRWAGALTLVAVGFFAARLTPLLETGRGSGLGLMGFADPGAARVRFVEPSPDGRIRIVLDETRQRTVSGALDDQNIRALLLAAAKDPADPGLRAETLDILNARAQAADVRNALVWALRHDQNAGVRLKAIEGLKAYARDPEVRSALTQTLLSDTNPGLRSQAIDLLTADTGQAMDRQIIGTLQELMRTESNAYVRERGQRVLEALNASAEIY